MKLIDLSRILLDQYQYGYLQRLLLELNSKEYEKYEDLSIVLPKIATIYSADDYIDFINQGFSINQDLFILGYLSYCDKCLETSDYDEDMFNNIVEYIKKQTDIVFDINSSFEKDEFDDNDLMCFLGELKNILFKNDFILLCFHSDQYYENQIFVFVLPDSLFFHQTKIDSDLCFVE